MRRTVLPLIRLFLRLRRTFHFDEDDIHADFFDLTDIDEQISPAPMKAFSAGDDDAEHPPLGIDEHNVANLSEAFTVDKIDRFFFSEFLKAGFHVLLYAEIYKS